VDLALNALADDKLHATVRCLAPNGSLLEIGKFDILKVRCTWPPYLQYVAVMVV
jgi:hypothetical protein